MQNEFDENLNGSGAEEKEMIERESYLFGIGNPTDQSSYPVHECRPKRRLQVLEHRSTIVPESYA